VRLLLQERASASGTDAVHSEVYNDTIIQDDELGILAADVDSGSDMGLERQGGYGMSRDLILDHIGAQDDAGQLTSAACGADANDVNIVRQATWELAQRILQGLDRASLSTPVERSYQIAIPRHRGHLRRHGAHINT
jgi:hypothetical protein